MLVVAENLSKSRKDTKFIKGIDVSGANKFQALFAYRKIIISENGPGSPTMRHILLTLSQFMDENLFCFPSISAITMATALTDRTVRKQLNNAVNEGWISRDLKGENGQGWKLYEYTGTVPKRAELNTSPLEVRTEPSTAPYPENVRHLIPKRAASNCKNVRKEVPTNRSSNRSVNRSGNLKKNNSRKILIPDDFCLTGGMITYAKKQRITNIKKLEDFTDNFVLQNKAKGYKYADHESAWKTWLRKGIKSGEIEKDPVYLTEAF